MKTFLIINLLLASSQSFANPVVQGWEIPGNDDGQVDSVQVIGCGADPLVSLQTLESFAGGSSQALTADLNLIASSHPAKADSFYCEIHGVVNVPAGKRFAIKAGFVDGRVRTQRFGSSDIHFRYRLAETGDRAVASKDFSGGSETSFALSAPIDAPTYTACSSQDQKVHLSAVIHGRVFDEDSEGSSLRLQGVSQESNTQWLWQWQSCDESGHDDPSLLPASMVSERGSSLKLTYLPSESHEGVVETYAYESYYPRLNRRYSGTLTIFLEDYGVIVESDSGYRYYGRVDPHGSQMSWFDVDFGYGPTDVVWHPRR